MTMPPSAIRRAPATTGVARHAVWLARRPGAVPTPIRAFGAVTLGAVALGAGALAAPVELAHGQRVREPADSTVRIDSATRAVGPRADTLVQTGVDVQPASGPGPGSAPGTLVNPGPTPLPTVGTTIVLRAVGRAPQPAPLVPIVVPFARCPFVLRVYRRPGGRGAGRADDPVARTGRPAWQSDAARPALACPPVESHGGSYVSASWDAAAVLGDSLPAGHYTFGYDVRLRDGRVLPFAAGGGYLTADPRPPVRADGALHFRAHTGVVRTGLVPTGGGPAGGSGAPALATTVWVRNPTERSLLLSYDDTPRSLRLQLTRAERRAGGGPPGRAHALVWSSDARAGVSAASGFRSRLMDRGGVIPPGDSLAMALVVPLGEVLADSVRPGRYRATAVVTLTPWFGADGRRVPGRVVRVHAGVVDLPDGS